MSDFDPIQRIRNLAARLNNVAGQMARHDTMNTAALNAALKTVEHVASAIEQDVNHRSESAAASEMQDAQGTAKIAEQEYNGEGSKR